MYAIRNKSNGLYLGTTQTEDGYYQSWNASESLVKFITFEQADFFSVCQGYDVLCGVDFEIVTLEAAVLVNGSLAGKIQKGLLMAAFSLLLLSGLAHRNYINALMAASNSCGSDSCIVNAMSEHGFVVDGLESEDPTMAAKVVALYKSF